MINPIKAVFSISDRRKVFKKNIETLAKENNRAFDRFMVCCGAPLSVIHFEKVFKE
jgi:hypothetical protein